jgi:hypothetical protein
MEKEIKKHETKEEALARIKARIAEIDEQERQGRRERLVLRDEWRALDL